MPTSEREKERVLAVIEDWRAAMAAGDAEGVISLWDPSYVQPVFMAPDYSHALPDLAAIRQAYAEQTQGMAGSQWTLTDIVADVLGEAAFVHCYVSIEAQFEGNAISFRDNNTFVSETSKDSGRSSCITRELTRRAQRGAADVIRGLTPLSFWRWQQA